MDEFNYNSHLHTTQCHRKQSSLWAEGDAQRQKINEQKNSSSRTAVSGILSGVEEISINETNKNTSQRKTSESVSDSSSRSFNNTSDQLVTDQILKWCVLIFSTLRKRMRTAVSSHRVTNSELWRVRDSPEHLQVHYRKLCHICPPFICIHVCSHLNRTCPLVQEERSVIMHHFYRHQHLKTVCTSGHVLSAEV